MNVFSDSLAYLFDGANWRGYDGMLALLVEQLLLTATAMVLAAGVALPLALTLGHLGRGGFLAINLTNFGRAVPTFALLAIFVVADPWGWTGGRFPGAAELGPYGRAGASTLAALALFALPPIVTNAYVAMREVPGEVVEAARGMGMTGRQLFFRVELPLALPLIVSGLRLALVQVWATATIAALVVGPGLGKVIVDGFDSEDYGKGIAGAVVVAVMALVLEVAASLVERWARPESGPPPARDVEAAVSVPAPTVGASADGGH
ncbi:ABC transporter permease subunit [Nocardioides lijunqiniae]|uniref:ABC transporter permease subunit n=1 Tax=Nocardioides lijunqiniae TaxID=2760832 RepID=UPI001877C025